MKKSWVRLTLFVIFIASITACDNGGDNNLTSTKNTVGQQGLSGQILLSGQGWLWRMNLSTGKFTKIPGTDWAEDINYHNLASFVLRPLVYVGDEYILRVRNCLPNDSKTSCVVTLDENAIKTSQFSLSGRISWDAKMSRNRKYVAFAIQYGGSITNDSYLEIYDRSGNLISSDLISDTAVTLYFDWLPDGRLVYVDNSGDQRSIYFTLPYSTKIDRQLTLPTKLQGTIRDISANPDGTQLAFSLVTSSSTAATVATPWVVNIDGTKIHQLAVDPHADGSNNSYVNNPKWSPDGRWILLTYGGATGGSIDNPGVLGYLFAVPSDGVKVPLSPYDNTIDTDAIHINSDWYATFYDQPGSTFNVERWPNRDYDWVQ